MASSQGHSGATTKLIKPGCQIRSSPPTPPQPAFHKSDVKTAESPSDTNQKHPASPEHHISSFSADLGGEHFTFLHFYISDFDSASIHQTE